VLNGHAGAREGAAGSPSAEGAKSGVEAESGAVEGADEAGAPNGDEAALRRRDAVLESITSRLARKLKRALQDEQNEILDRLRSYRGAPSEELLPSGVDQGERYRRTSAELLEEAAVAGTRFMVPEASLTPEVADLNEGLAEALGAPLRRRLQRCLAAEDAEDSAATAEHISAAYREWKTQLVDRLAGDATISAFSRGVAQVAPGALLRWVVDDDGGPCPDCYDNALAGATPSGDSYPTGQMHPPAHAGCRCLLVPANP
ncbi:MAG TPA: hypothetical protein VK988_04615, partial [Acidimicrobiales bacterium]|nr:hypothetical protein [Acidimicrobiales bacterium]